MKTIYDHELYAELKKDLSWETLFDDHWPKNYLIPRLAGGLDHIHRTKKFFEFHDIGCNGRDNSFRIGDREEKMIKHTELKEVIAGIAKELGWSVMSDDTSSYVDSVGGVVYFDNYQNDSVRIQYYFVLKTDSAVRIEADICTYIGGKATKQTLIDRYLKLKSDVISVYNSINPIFKYDVGGI